MPNNQPTTSQEDNDQGTIITPESPASPHQFKIKKNHRLNPLRDELDL